MYDRGEPARAASWAGAGMLAPYTERIESEALLAFVRVVAARSIPSSCAERYDAGGVDAHLRLDGVVYAAFDAAALEGLCEHGAQLARRGVACTMLDRASTLRAEPWLGPATVGALLMDGEGHVDNRRLGRALVAACQARGVRIESSASIEVECDARRVRGVRTERDSWRAGAVVNACGAWAAQLRGVSVRLHRHRCEPVKGQMLALAVPAGFVRRATWVPASIWFRVSDGRLLLGATVESAGFDERVTAQGMRELLARGLKRRTRTGRFLDYRAMGRAAAGNARRLAVHRADAARRLLARHRSLSKRNSARAGDRAVDCRCPWRRRFSRAAAVCDRSPRHGRGDDGTNVPRVRATINGVPRELPDAATVGAVLELLGSARQGVAVSRNDRVVRRAEYDVERLTEGDRIEIIEAVAGG